MSSDLPGIQRFRLCGFTKCVVDLLQHATSPQSWRRRRRGRRGRPRACACVRMGEGGGAKSETAVFQSTLSQRSPCWVDLLDLAIGPITSGDFSSVLRQELRKDPSQQPYEAPRALWPPGHREWLRHLGAHERPPQWYAPHPASRPLEQAPAAAAGVGSLNGIRNCTLGPACLKTRAADMTRLSCASTCFRSCEAASNVGAAAAPGRAPAAAAAAAVRAGSEKNDSGHPEARVSPLRAACCRRLPPAAICILTCRSLPHVL